jgi:signal transduction histidine kinase
VIGLLRLARRHLDLLAEVLGYGLWLVVDLSVTTSTGSVLSMVSGVVAALIVLSRRLPRARLRTVAAVAVGVSLALSVLSWSRVLVSAGLASTRSYDFSFTEQLALAILVVVALRRGTLPRALLVTIAAGVAILASPLLRFAAIDQQSLAVFPALGWGGTVVVGLVVREIEARRRTMIDGVRSAERLELARELHDVVAHHVTGIVVAAQAAAVVARTSPDDVDRALAAIESAGSEALAAMRRTVGVLRGEAAADGSRTPGARLGDVAALVARFDPEGTLVRLRTEPGLEQAVLPPGLAATGYRVVQESLTNVRRHAPQAGAVEVDLQVQGEALLVTVRNDGLTAANRPRGGTGGFGLVGMAERVTAMDGELTAGPAGEGVWTVSARLPLNAARG